MQIVKVDYKIIGPLICFSSFSVLFGSNSVDKIHQHYKSAGYSFFSITDLNLLSSFIYMNAINNLNKLYGITIKVQYQNAIGNLYVVFYCHQGYYNFLNIYNKKILETLKSNVSDPVFTLDDFKNVRNNYGFYVIIGNLMSVLYQFYKSLLVECEQQIVELQIKRFVKKITLVFYNNLVWQVSKINKFESLLFDLIYKYVTNKDSIIYGYPIVNLTNFFVQNYLVSPHTHLLAIAKHQKITDLMMQEDACLGNEYCLHPVSDYIDNIGDTPLLHNTYLFFKKLCFFKLDLRDHELSLKFKHAKRDINTIINNNFKKLIIQFHEAYGFIGRAELVAKCDKYYDRLMHELQIYNKIHEQVDVYSMLFIMYKIIRWSKNNNINIGPGRGSCVGSLVIYLLDITTIDPIQHQLLFERFLNINRANMPDIDVDVCKTMRNTLLKHTVRSFQSHSEGNVMHIIVFSKFVFKMMIKDLIRVSNSSLKFIEINKILQAYDDKEKLERLVSSVNAMLATMSKHAYYVEFHIMSATFKSFFLRAIIFRLYRMVCEFLLLREDARAHMLYITSGADTLGVIKHISSRFIELTNIVKDLDYYSHCIKTTGIHAAGILIGEKRFAKKIPLFIGSNADGEKTLCTHYDIDMLSSMNVTKFDILGLDNLTIIQEFHNILGLEYNPNIIFDFMLDHRKAYSVYSMLRRGSIKNVFQMEKVHIAKIAKMMHINRFDDIVALNALNRPGTSQTINMYVQNKKTGQIDDAGNNPYFRQVTSNTYGVIIYQEQIMEIARLMANYSEAESDVFRSAISKKKFDLLKLEREKFISRCIENHIQPEVAAELFETINRFAGYAFNKSHAVAYSKITVITAYIKYYYYIQYSLVCIQHKYHNVNKVIEIMVEMLVYARVWFAYDNKYNFVNYLNYETQCNSLNFNFFDIQCLNIIYVSLPIYLAKGIAKTDIELLTTQGADNIDGNLLLSNITKAKLKILNEINFFQCRINVEKMCEEMETLKKMRHRIKNVFYTKIHNNQYHFINKHVADQPSLKTIDAHYMLHTGISLVRANIITIIRYIADATCRDIGNNLFIAYKAYKGHIHLLNIKRMAYQRSIYTKSLSTKEFDVFFIHRGGHVNITDYILQHNNFGFIKHIFKFEPEVNVQYTCGTKLKITSLFNLNVEDLFDLLNKRQTVKLVLALNRNPIMSLEQVE